MWHDGDTRVAKAMRTFTEPITVSQLRPGSFRRVTSGIHSAYMLHADAITLSQVNTDCSTPSTHMQTCRFFFFFYPPGCSNLN